MSSQAGTEYTIYFAGPLFDYKDLKESKNIVDLDGIIKAKEAKGLIA